MHPSHLMATGLRDPDSADSNMQELVVRYTAVPLEIADRSANPKNNNAQLLNENTPRQEYFHSVTGHCCFSG